MRLAPSKMMRWTLLSLTLLPSFMLAACVSRAGITPDAQQPGEASVVMHVVTVLLERPGRIYDPALSFFEVQQQETGRRYRVDVEDADKVVVFYVPPGSYEVTRAQVSEGPFRSMADLQLRFEVSAEHPTYLGTWRLGIQSPRYGRMMLASSTSSRDALLEDFAALSQNYPNLHGDDVNVTRLVPHELEARLYEVMPYPRSQQYFRRHQW